MSVDGDATPLARRYLAARFDEPSLVPDVVAEFGEHLADTDLRRFEDVELVVAVPSRTTVASAFAALVAERLGRPLVLPAPLTWVRDVPPLKAVPPAERAALIADALSAGPLSGSVLLVDDVVRTTATFAEATRAVLAGGAARVMCLAMVRVD